MIIGHSGCVVSIKDGILEKTNGDNYCANRLLNQAEKQILFRKNNSDDRIVIPEIIESIKKDSTAVIKMSYINALDIIEFLESSEKDDLDFLISVLLDFITLNIKNSVMKKIAFDVVQEKWDSVISKINFDTTIIEKKYDEFPKENLLLPIGPCHGDLSLSNVLIAGKEVVLIDFLTNFIETPFADILKIRQDTRHNWSTFRCNRDHDKNKVNESLRYIDNIIVRKFENEVFWNHYNFMQFLNMVRIIPYSDMNTTQFIMEQICQI